jgi:hypothetical protein
LELKELVIDKPGEQEPAKEDLSRFPTNISQTIEIRREICGNQVFRDVYA